jgi:perosamine synthetase
MRDSLAREFVAAVRSVAGDEPVIGLHEPELGDVEKQYVTEALDSGFVSSVGEFVTRFEDEIAAFTGARSAVVVSNGTSALHVALVLAGVEPGDEVLVPALSFIATANAVVHAGAQPHFVDSSATTLGLDVGALASVIDGFEKRNGAIFNPRTGARVSATRPKLKRSSNLLSATDWSLSRMRRSRSAATSGIGTPVLSAGSAF